MEGPLMEEEQRVLDEFMSNIEQASGDKSESVDNEATTEERPRTPQKSQSCAEPWKRAVKRLYRTVVSVSEANNDYSNPEDALNALLEEVANNENLTEEDLVNKFRKSKNDTGEIDEEARKSKSATNSISSGDVGEGRLKQESPNRDDDEDEDEEEIKIGKRHEFFDRLTKVGQILTNGGGSCGLNDLDDILFKENVANKFQSAIEYVVSKLQEQWDFILNVFMPRQQLQTLIFVSFVHVISVQRVFGFLPHLICYAAFSIMIYSTLAMFGSRTWLKRAENWRRLLTVFQSGDDRNEGETKIEQGNFYCWKSTEPYATFFISLAVFVFSLALIDGQESGMIQLKNSWSMCAVSAFFALLCFLALADRHDIWAVAIMILDVSSSMPAILEKFGVATSRFPVIGFMLENREIYQCGLLRIQFGLPSLAVLATIIVYGFMIAAYPRRDIYTVVVPHLVCVAWWHTSLELFLVNDNNNRSVWASIGWYDVALTLGVIWLITFPTVAALVLVAGVVVAQLRNVLDSVSLMKTCVTATILLLPFLYRKLRQLAEKRNWTTTNRSTGKGQLKSTILTLIVYGLLVFTSAAVLYESRFASGDGGGGKLAKELTWSRYEKYCSYGDENLENRLRQQMACSQLRGAIVKWKGTVQGVRIVKIDNIFETVLSYLPDELASRLRCFYGERVNETASVNSVMQGLAFDSCTLINHNVYTFEIDAAGPWGQHTFSSAKGSVVLVASATFQELATEFEQGDVIEFSASFLGESLLKYPPKLKLIQLQCLACQHVSAERHATRYAAAYQGNLWTKLFDACCFLFNFLCSPLFVIG